MNNRWGTIYLRHISIRLSDIILGLLIVALIILGFYYLKGDLNTKFTTLLGGLIATFVAVIIQYLLAWNEHREVERMRRMGFYDVLPNRDDRKQYYANLLTNAKEQINFIGKTANRFLEDFAYTEPGATKKDRLLIQALSNNVRVRILIAQKNHLPESKYDDHVRSIKKLDLLKKDYPEHLDYKFLSTAPTQTFVRVDSRCVFGPVFPSIESRVTPAVHADTMSPFLEQYLIYFEREWKGDHS